MRRILLISLLILSIILIGCKKNVYGCNIKGHFVRDIELCEAIQESEWESYEQGKLIGESCDDEVISDTYNSAYERCMEESSSRFMDNCLLIVTDGKQPEDNEWYQEMDMKQIGDNIFPIRTWDLERDHIESYDGLVWKYWMTCDRP